jgi:hypothetical protein
VWVRVGMDDSARSGLALSITAPPVGLDTMKNDG